MRHHRHPQSDATPLRRNLRVVKPSDTARLRLPKENGSGYVVLYVILMFAVAAIALVLVPWLGWS